MTRALLRELLAEGQGHQQRRGKSMRRQLRDRCAPGRDVVVTRRDRFEHGGDERPRDRLLRLLLCFVRASRSRR
jgi:hypothetical protein